MNGAAAAIRLTVLLGIALAAVPAAGQQSWEVYRAEATRVEEGPRVDGVMDEAVWRLARPIDGFVQQEPREGEPASERTEVRVLYDRNTLYFGVIAFDSDPGGVVATEMRRDSDRVLEEDNFQLILDTFKDARSGYMFAVSPLGAKLEQQIAEEGEGGRRGVGVASNINRDWDGVWDAAARRTDEGWVAEIAIPAVTLRFPPGEVQDWGINFMRNISRKNEQVYWAPVAKGYGLTRVSMAGSLTNLGSLSRGRDLRVKPFVVGGGRRILSDGTPDNTLQQDMGVDLKYGIAAGLNLDLTLNTDFAQAEVDDERVNLTRFALFYPEKRYFFQENSGLFTVGTTTSIERIADLFFSRRIGISERGEQLPILAGARLTGKLGRNNIAVMDVQTDEAFGHPGENFLVARYSRDFMGRSRIGALLVNKQATEGGHYNRTYAADLTLNLSQSLMINGFLAKTETPGVSDGEMGGHLRAAYLDQRWNVYTEFTDLQENFNAEVGFVPRVGIRTSKFHIERNPRPVRYGIRVLEPMYNVTYTTDQENRLVSRRHHFMLGTRLNNGMYLNLWWNNYFERLEVPFALRPDVVIAPGAYTFDEPRISFSSNPARRLYGSVAYSPQTFFDGDRTDVDLRLGYRLSSRFSTEGGYARNDVALPAGAFRADIGSLRLDYALSPEMTLRTLTQYNSLTQQWSTSARFHYLYRPGSDFYIVYNELRRDPTGLTEFRDRHLILKMTYLVSR